MSGGLRLTGASRRFWVAANMSDCGDSAALHVTRFGVGECLSSLLRLRCSDLFQDWRVGFSDNENGHTGECRGAGMAQPRDR